MARRRQTTGMPRKDRQKNETPENTGLIDNLLGNPTSRGEREAALNRLIQRSVLVIVGVITFIVAAILIYDFLIVPQNTVATVNGETITVAEFRQRVEFERALTIQNYNARISQLQQQAAAFGVDINQLAGQDQQLNQWAQELNNADILGNRVIDTMINDLLIEQEFEALGLELTDDLVEGARQDFFGYDPTEAALIGTPATATLTPTSTSTPLVPPTATATALPTLTPTLAPTTEVVVEATAEVTAEVTSEVTAEVTAEVTGEAQEPTETPTIPPTPTQSSTDVFENYQESVDIFVDNIRDADVSQAAVDAFWERQAIRDAVAQAIAGDIDMATYVNARHILVETQEEAQAIYDALLQGESFSTLAQAQSLDTGSGQRGGELGWQAVDLYVPAFAETATNAPIGVIQEPVESDFGWHIIQVTAREERELTEQVESQIQQSRFGTWITERRETADEAGEVEINENWPNFLD